MTKWKDISSYKPEIFIDYMLEITFRDGCVLKACGFFDEERHCCVYDTDSVGITSTIIDAYVELKFKEWE